MIDFLFGLMVVLSMVFAASATVAIASALGKWRKVA